MKTGAMENGKMLKNKVYEGNCLDILPRIQDKIDLTFLDPPFNQNKDYKFHNDNLSDEEYWGMMLEVNKKIFKAASRGGAIYFMQREKNTKAASLLQMSGMIFVSLLQAILQVMKLFGQKTEKDFINNNLLYHYYCFKAVE